MVERMTIKFLLKGSVKSLPVWDLMNSIFRSTSSYQKHDKFIRKDKKVPRERCRSKTRILHCEKIF